MTVLLAQSSQGADRLFADILPWLGLLVVIILLGGGTALFLRRRFASSGETATSGFTLADLRTMRDSGEISEAEFATAKSRMLESMKPMDRTETPSPKGPNRRPDPRAGMPPVRRPDARDADDGAG